MIERIKKLITVKNISASGLANEIGVQRSSVSHILSGRNKASLDFVLKLKERYTDLNLDWLLYGTGEMFVRETKSEIKRKTDNMTQKNIGSKSDSKPEFSFENSIKQSADLFSNDRKTEAPVGIDNKTLVEEPQMARSEDMPYYGFRTKKILKVVLLYEDMSFEEYTPKKKPDL